MKISVPKSFGIEHVDEFLNEAQIIFKIENKLIPGFIFDLSKIKQVGLIGQLLIYKFISYTAENHCFLSPTILSSEEQWIEKKLKEYGFFDIIMAYVNKDSRKKILDSYKGLSLRELTKDKTRVLIAPQRLLRDEIEIRDSLEQKLFSDLYAFYGRNIASKIATTCIGELLTNFWSHATIDSGTVMVAMGNKYFIEICIADNGLGIVSTLKSADSKYRKLPSAVVLEKALEKGVTSKPKTSHMGLGLFLIKEIVKANNGHMHIFTEGVYAEIRPNKMHTGQTGYWKGTIVYIKLDFSKPTPLEEIPSLQPSGRLCINWR